MGSDPNECCQRSRELQSLVVTIAGPLLFLHERPLTLAAQRVQSHLTMLRRRKGWVQVPAGMLNSS